MRFMSFPHPLGAVTLVLVVCLQLCCAVVAKAQSSEPSGTGTTYYVSPTGDDLNSGTAPNAPWRSLGRIQQSVYNAGDSILLEGGKTFVGCLQISRGMLRGTAERPVTIGAYGHGKFQIKSNCAGRLVAAIDIVGASGVVVQDCTLRGNGGKTPFGVWIQNPYDNDAARNITVRRCDISGFFTTSPGQNGAEIFVTGHPGAGLDGVNVIDNVLHGSDGPTSPDNNGLYGFGRDKNVRNILYQGNVIYDIGGRPGGTNGADGNGMIANGVTGGLIQNNIAYNLGANVDTCGGPSGFWAYSSSHIVIQFNEVYNAKPSKFVKGCDWDGFDLDGYVTDSVLQYNYAHDNWGAGFAAYIDGEWGRNIIRYNVAVNNATSWGASYFGNIVIARGADSPQLSIYNNTLISNGPSNTTAGISIQGNPKGAIIANNLIIALNGANYINTGSELPEVQILSNSYYLTDQFAIRWRDRNYTNLDTWRQATGNETLDGKSTAFTDDPQLDTTALGEICGGYKRSCPRAALHVSQKLMGRAIDLTKPPFNLDVGSRDYVGNKIPQSGSGTGYGIGAVVVDK
ncbi:MULTISPECIES: right-handed parallel beta-helix repeat-containing protein [unclassified Hyphomicrobium]|uniref:right-handed parallel beta-helix repeat-containing protein n=1 Tax=unclassified Hyphomicrobium TaxID=2619925 RepID=UPI000213EB52|nr:MULTISPECIES: right-handed parallel beta-helix repeat-containing protein [unclassified Hyphomicrobium]CCB66018.1 putative PA14 domain-containing protein [Hyphomicrobium sp. MC1]